MDKKGYEAITNKFRNNGVFDSLSPRPEHEEDLRFVKLLAFSPSIVTAMLNDLNFGGFMESHQPRDEAASNGPGFRVISIEGRAIFLEDTNSRNY